MSVTIMSCRDPVSRSAGAGGYGSPGLLGDQVPVDRRGGGQALGRGRDDLGLEVGDVARQPDAGHRGQAGLVGLDDLARLRAERVRRGTGRRPRLFSTAERATIRGPATTTLRAT
jgi:hypothetical protein